MKIWEVFLKRYSNILVIFLLCFSFISIFGAEGKEDKTEKAINDFMTRIEIGPLDPVQIKGIKKLAKSKDEKISARATALLAKYICECENKPDKALSKIAPFVLSLEKSEEFAKEDKPGTVKIFPPVSDWQLKNPQCCVAAAGILAYQKKYPEALAGLNFVGEKLDGIPRALAAEGVGDILYDMKQFQASADAFILGIKVLDFFKKSSEYLYYPDKAVDIIYQRIQGKLSKAERALDCERYGPEFVAYREARKFEFSCDFLRAIVYYGRIVKDFPDTVYSEAAKLYRPKCLFRLADKSESEKAKSEIIGLETQIQKDRAMLKKDSEKMSRRIVEAFENLIKEDETLLPEMKNVPTGEKAAEEAVPDLERFISENEFGLYRGEAIIDLGEYYLEKKVDPETAFNYFTRAKNWLEKVESVKTDISSWRVPQKAAGVSAPPPGDKTLAGWNYYMIKTPIKPEQIINRATTPWYLDSLRARADKTLSFLHYMKGEKEAALALAGSVLKYEPIERQFNANHEPNTYKRLVTYYKRGWMYAKPEELDLFKGKLRTAVLLGDFYYAQEEWEKCVHHRQDILDGKYGKLNKEQTADMIFRVADASVWFEEKDDTAIKMLQPFLDGEYKGTYIRAHALISLGSLAGKQLRDKAGQEKSILCYGEALKEIKDNKCELADRARFFMSSSYHRGLGDTHKVEGSYEKALDLCKTILKNPDTIYKNVCIKRINDIEKIIKDKKEEK